MIRCREVCCPYECELGGICLAASMDPAPLVAQPGFSHTDLLRPKLATWRLRDDALIDGSGRLVADPEVTLVPAIPPAAIVAHVKWCRLRRSTQYSKVSSGALDLPVTVISLKSSSSNRQLRFSGSCSWRGEVERGPPCFLTHTFWNSVSGVFLRFVFIGMQPVLWRALRNGE